MTDEPKPTAEGASRGDAGDGRRRAPRRAQAEAQPSPQGGDAEPEAARRRGRREPEAEEAPKPKRTRRKAAPKAESRSRGAGDEDEPVSADADAEADRDADEDETTPKPRTTPARPSPSAAAAALPRPPRRRQPVHRTSPAPRAADGTVVVRAQAKYVRCAPRKARLVVDHIRGKSIEEARAILTHTPRAAARDVLKLLESAVANAENNHELDADDLVVRKVYVDEGPTLKRYRPRALGRATRIRKRTSHMTIQLSPKE